MENNKDHISFEDLPRSLPKQNNFKIPEGYFDQLASDLEGSLEIKNRSLKKGTLRILVINVSIAAAVILGVFLFKPSYHPVGSIKVLAADEDVTVEDYLISMVDATEDWTPLEYYSIDSEDFEIIDNAEENTEIPVVEETTSQHITDFFEDDDNDYEL